MFFAVTSYSQNLTIGVRIGDNQSKLTGDYGLEGEFTDYVSVNNFHYGIFLNYYLNNNLSIQPEINYKIKGFEYHTKEGIDGGSYNGNADFNYLEIPVLINYSYGNKFKIFANCGPSINILISGGEYNYQTWSSHMPGGVTNYYSRNIKSDFHALTLGINGGVGIKYKIFSNVELFSEFQVSYDITDTTEKNEVIDENTGRVWYYNNPRYLDLSIDFGISYRLGK